MRTLLLILLLLPSLARAEAPQIIVMGSSRVRDALSPRDLERALRLPTGAVLNLFQTYTQTVPAETSHDVLIYRLAHDG